MDYSSDAAHNDMTVEAGFGAFKLEKIDLPVPLTQAETRPEPFKGICSAAGFTSQRERYAGTRNLETVSEN